MQRKFNVNGLCYPDEHYMVNLDSRIREIRRLVDEQKYFVINRARQYGKTTVLWALKKYLREGLYCPFHELSENEQRGISG